MKHYPQMNKYFKRFLQLSAKNKKRELTKYVWGLIIVPIIQDKKQVINFIDNVKEVVEFYAFEQEADQLSSCYDNYRQEWEQKK